MFSISRKRTTYENREILSIHKEEKNTLDGKILETDDD